MSERTPPSTITVHVPLKFTIRGGRKAIIGELPRPATRTRFDDSITKALARAHRWRTRLEEGTYRSVTEIAQAERINASYVCRILRLTLLAPDIVERLLDQQDSTLTVEDLVRPMSSRWKEQREHFKFRSAVLADR
jgi:hypothetical protein